MVGVLQHDVPRRRVGDDMLQIAEIDVLLDSDELGGCRQRDDLTVVRISETDRPLGAVGHHNDSRRPPIGPAADEAIDPTDHRPRALRQWVFSDADADVQMGPARVDITVQPIEERVAGEPARLAHERAGGGPRPDGETHGPGSFWRCGWRCWRCALHFSRGHAGGQVPITESEARFLRPGSKFAIVLTTWILLR